MAEVITHPYSTAPASAPLRPYDTQIDRFNPYAPQPVKGSGYTEVDTYVADRISILSDSDHIITTLPAVTSQLQNMPESEYLQYIRGSIAATFDASRARMLDLYSGRLAGAAPEDVDAVSAEAVDQIKSLDSLNAEDAIAALSEAALKELDLFDENSIGKYVAKSQYMALMLEVLLKKNGMDLAGFKQHALDFLGAAIPGRQLWQTITGSFGKGAITPANYYRNVQAFRSATTAQQFAALPQLVQSLAEYSGGNVTLFTSRIMPYFGESDARELLAWLAVDALDVTLTAKALPSFLRMARLLAARNTPIKLLRDAGRRAEAGEAVAEAAGDPKVAAALRTTQDDAAASISPFQGEGIAPELTNGVAAESQLAIANRVAAVEKTMAPIHDASSFVIRANHTPEAIAKMNAKHLAKAAGNAVVKEQYTDGFLMEVAIETPSLGTPTRKSLQLKQTELEELALARTQELHEAKLAQGSPYSTARPVDEIEKELAQIATDLEQTSKRLDDLGPMNKAEIQAQIDGVQAAVREQTLILQRAITDAETAKRASGSSFGEAAAGSVDDTGAAASRATTRLEDLHKLLSRLEAQLKVAPKAPEAVTSTAQTTRLERVYYRYDEFDELVDVEVPGTFVDQYVLSPSETVDIMRPGTVPEATVRDMTADKISQHFGKAFREALHGLGKRSRKKLDRILLAGDKEGRVYTALELEAGITTPAGLVRLRTEQEIGAYYSVRKIFDRMHPIKNEDLRRGLAGEGYLNSVIISGIDGAEETLAFLKAQNTATPSRVWDMASGSVITLGRRAVDDPRVLYRTKYPIERGAQGSTKAETLNYVLVDPNKISALPEQVLRYRPGYVTKIHKNIFWVATRYRPAMVDGVAQIEASTARFFDNLADANEWTAAQRAKGEKMDVVAGRDWIDAAPGRREEFEAQIFGGPYSGKRSDTQIPFGLEGTEAERLGAFESLEAYMNHIAHRMSAADFRMSLIRRFLKSAADGQGGSYLTEPGNWKSALRPDVPPNVRTNLEIWRTWTMDQIRIPTTEERVWGTVMQRIAELGASLPIRPVRRIASRLPMKIGSKDVTSALRGTAFHATLGWFNPVQLLVQGFGMALGMAIDPIGFVANMPRLMGLRYAMFATDIRVAEQIGKALGLNNKEFLEMMRAYRKTGLHESTLMTADYMDLHGGWSSASTLRNVARLGLLPFQEGERMMRNMAWLQAYDKIKATRKLKVFSDVDIDDALKLSLKYTMNLHRANRAYWQKGVLSIPTQFFQIFTKFTENMASGLMGKPGAAWTQMQSARILFTHLVLFGAAGVPAGESLLKNVLDWAQSDDEWGLAIKDEKTKIAVTDGLIGLLAYNITGVEMDISSRLSIPSNVQFLIDVASQNDQGLTEQFLGVSSTILHRTYLASAYIARLIAPVMYDMSLMEPAIAVQAMDSVASIASSWSNIRKARWYDANVAYMNSKGEKIDGIRPESQRAVIWAQALGISTKKPADLRVLNDLIKADQKEIRETVRTLIEISARYEATKATLGVGLSEQLRDAMMASVVKGYSDEDKIKIMNSLYDHKAKDGFLLPEAIDKAIDIMIKNGGASEAQVVGSMLEKK